MSPDEFDAVAEVPASVAASAHEQLPPDPYTDIRWMEFVLSAEGSDSDE